MTIYTLYVKTHRKTGLKYLGQTSQNPIVYIGSGIDWIRHLKENGRDIETIIVAQSTDREIINDLGRECSLRWNVVNAMDDFGNKIWANRIPETGGGSGAKLKGIQRSLATRERIKKAMPDQSGQKNSFFGKTHTENTKLKCGLSNKGKDIKTIAGKMAISNAIKDHTYYTFSNEDGRIFTGKRQDFFTTFKFGRNTQSCFAKLINSKIEKYKGWTVIKTTSDILI